MAKKDFAAMERDLPSGAEAARAAMRSRMAHPTRLRLEELQSNPRNPRYHGNDPEVQELAATLNRVGQLQPALVISREQYAAAMPDEARLGPEPWVVIVGNRRLAASRIAGRPTLDVRVVDELGDADDIEDRVLIENVHRRDLPPLLEAEILRRRLDRPGASLRTVAAAIGKSHVYVNQRVALLSLVPELQGALRDGRIGIRHGRELARRSEDDQRWIAARLSELSEDEARLLLDGGATASATPVDGATSGPRGVNPVNGTAGSEVAQDDAQGELGSGNNRSGVNRVNTQDGTAGSEVAQDDAPVTSSARTDSGKSTERPPAAGSGLGTDLEETRRSVTQWLDNAAADLDKALPSGGDDGAGGQLAEARRLIVQARAVLWPTS